MTFEFDDALRERKETFREYVNEHVVPHADRWHRSEETPPEAIDSLAQRGWLGATLPQTHGGGGMDPVEYAAWMEEIGRGCSSLRSLVTVHCMAAHMLQRWANAALLDAWIPRLASGDALAAFALSEPNAGSDASAIETTAVRRGDAYVLNGEKKWTTYGQIADVFLVFARCDGDVAAFWVERDRPGLSTTPMTGLIGTRASMTARVHLSDCSVPASHAIQGRGFGVSHLVTTALTHGRLSVAMGCVGLAQACVNAAAAYTSQREQFGAKLNEHQLVRRKITEMSVGLESARLLGYRAASLQRDGDPRSLTATNQAKYHAARVARSAANDAVQLHGGNGCSDAYPVQRFLGDAKVMEIIEGSNQIHQISIAKDVGRTHARQAAHPAYDPAYDPPDNRPPDRAAPDGEPADAADGVSAHARRR